MVDQSSEQHNEQQLIMTTEASGAFLPACSYAALIETVLLGLKLSSNSPFGTTSRCLMYRLSNPGWQAGNLTVQKNEKFYEFCRNSHHLATAETENGILHNKPFCTVSKSCKKHCHWTNVYIEMVKRKHFEFHLNCHPHEKMHLE